MQYDTDFKKTNNICLYKLVDDDNNIYKCSNCKEEWQITEGTLEDNNIHYCPICGYKISNDLKDSWKYCKECSNRKKCKENYWCIIFDNLKMYKGSFVCDNFKEEICEK